VSTLVRIAASQAAIRERDHVPPHEPQGMYGVFDSDQTTIAVLHDRSQAMRRAVA